MTEVNRSTVSDVVDTPATARRDAEPRTASASVVSVMPAESVWYNPCAVFTSSSPKLVAMSSVSPRSRFSSSAETPAMVPTSAIALLNLSAPCNACRAANAEPITAPMPSSFVLSNESPPPNRSLERFARLNPSSIFLPASLPLRPVFCNCEDKPLSLAWNVTTNSVRSTMRDYFLFAASCRALVISFTS